MFNGRKRTYAGEGWVAGEWNYQEQNTACLKIAITTLNALYADAEKKFKKTNINLEAIC